MTRWEREEGLPVHRHLHSKTGTVYAHRSEIEEWWTSRGKQIEKERPESRVIPPTRLGRRLAIAAATGAAALFTLGWLYFRSAPRFDAPRLIPLTTYPGIEGPPSLSPDGSQAAFERNGDLFVKHADGEAFVRLTSTAATESSPAWSPDGRQIAFLRDGSAIYLISPLGGSERKVAETRAPVLLNTMAWMPDGESVIVSELTSSICASLFQVSVTTGEKKRLTSPSEPSIGDGWPAVSPDGRTIAFARYSQDSGANIHLLSSSGGQPRPITAERASLYGLAWTPDGRDVVFSSNRDGGFRLWRARAPSGTAPPAPVEGAGEDARFPSISAGAFRRSGRLAYQRLQQNLDIRRAEISGEGTAQHMLKPSSPFLVSTRSEDHPQYSPDGKKIAFVSNRSGSWEVWVCDSEGSQLARLTSMGGPAAIGPRWSPNGRRLAFFAPSGASGEYHAYLIDAEGGAPRRLSRDQGFEAVPSWSGDGRSIYFASGRTGSLEIWKMTIESGASVQITRGGGAEGSESPDGRLLYYARAPEVGPGLWSVPVAGGEENRVLDGARFGYWAVTRKGIYFIDFNAPKDAPRSVKFFRFDDRRTKVIGTVENGVDWKNNPGFAVSPNSRWLLYSRLETTEGDLMLVDNFR